uniref:Uncharacterized protein n=1 Tax=Arundo donax TaxID=35708 RepID=A0A0A9FHL4_ARUDO
MIWKDHLVNTIHIAREPGGMAKQPPFGLIIGLETG